MLFIRHCNLLHATCKKFISDIQVQLMVRPKLCENVINMDVSLNSFIFHLRTVLQKYNLISSLDSSFSFLNVLTHLIHSFLIFAAISDHSIYAFLHIFYNSDILIILQNLLSFHILYQPMPSIINMFLV